MVEGNDLKRLSEEIKKLFNNRLGQFCEEDFVAVADRLGFHAYKKVGSDQQLKPIAENYFPDIIGTNLRYALETYEWDTHIPMSDNGLIVSGFWDSSKGENIPDSYEMASESRFLIKKRD